MKNSIWKKILSVGLVLVMCAVTFSAAVTNVLADEDDGEEKIIVSLNPYVATNGNIHIVWQENVSNYEIFYCNDAQHNYEVTLTEAIEELSSLDDKDSQKALENLNDALNDCLEQDFKHSIDNVHHAVKNLEKAENTELINTLVDAVRDFAKTNILYAEYDLTFNNSYIQEAYDKYYLAVDKYEKGNYDSAVEQFKNSYLKIVEAYEENDETYVGVDFGEIVRISYTDYDSVNATIYLNGTINVCWEEIIGNETHAYFARSSNNGITWWYFDATEHAYTYLSYAGINPDMLSSENKLLITKTLERILILEGCHYFYVPIIRDGFIIEDRRVYSPIDDPYLTLYEYHPIYIGDKKIYIICGGGGGGDPVLAPDLTVESITFSNTKLNEGEATTISATINNIGDASVSGTICVRFYNGDTSIGGSAIFFSLNVSESKSASINWIPTWDEASLGYYNIKVKVDPDNMVPEGDEYNNENTKHLEIAVNWIVTGSETYKDTGIVLKGDLTIKDGASLTFDNVTLIMNCTYNGEFTIMVESCGQLYVSNSLITSSNPANRCRFEIYGKAIIVKTEITHLYGDETTGIGGLQVYSDDVSISGSSISYSDICGIYIKTSSPTIINTTITETNGIDIYIDGECHPFLLDTMFDKKKICFSNYLWPIVIRRYIHVKTVDGNCNPMSDVFVTVTDKDNNILYDGKTDIEGYARWIACPMYAITSQGTTYLEHTVLARDQAGNPVRVLEGYETEMYTSIMADSEKTNHPSLLAIDNDPNTVWVGADSQTFYSIQIDLDKEPKISIVKIYYPENCLDGYTYTLSAYGISETGIASVVYSTTVIKASSDRDNTIYFGLCEIPNDATRKIEISFDNVNIIPEISEITFFVGTTIELPVSDPNGIYIDEITGEISSATARFTGTIDENNNIILWGNTNINGETEEVTLAGYAEKVFVGWDVPEGATPTYTTVGDRTITRYEGATELYASRVVLENHKYELGGMFYEDGRGGLIGKLTEERNDIGLISDTSTTTQISKTVSFVTATKLTPAQHHCVFLSVPYRTQMELFWYDPYDYDAATSACGHASAAMLQEYWTGTRPSLKDIWDWSGHDAMGIDDIEDYFDSHDVPCWKEYYQGTLSEAIDTVEDRMDWGWPIILSNAKGGGHWVVVTGYWESGRTFYLNDPGASIFVVGIPGQLMHMAYVHRWRFRQTYNYWWWGWHTGSYYTLDIYAAYTFKYDAYEWDGGSDPYSDGIAYLN